MAFMEKKNGKPLQDSCLENPMDRGAWQAMVHGVARVRYDGATKERGRDGFHVVIGKGTNPYSVT